MVLISQVCLLQRLNYSCLVKRWLSYGGLIGQVVLLASPIWRDRFIFRLVRWSSALIIILISPPPFLIYFAVYFIHQVKNCMSIASDTVSVIAFLGNMAVDVVLTEGQGRFMNLLTTIVIFFTKWFRRLTLIGWCFKQKPIKSHVSAHQFHISHCHVWHSCGFRCNKNMRDWSFWLQLFLFLS